MDRDVTLLLFGFIGGAIAAVMGAAAEAILAYWLEGRRERRRLQIEDERERRRLEFEKAQEKERIRREQYEAALRYHETRKNLRGFDLAGQDLSEANLAGADLRGFKG